MPSSWARDSPCRTSTIRVPSMTHPRYRRPSPDQRRDGEAVGEETTGDPPGSPLVTSSPKRSFGDETLEVLHATAGHRRGALLLGLVGDDGLGGEEQGRDRGGVLQRRPGDLGGVDDPGLGEGLVGAGGGVAAF